MKIGLVLALALALSVAGAQGAAAAGKSEEPQWGGRQLALGVGEEHGFNGLVRLRFNHVAIEGALGAMPYVLSAVAGGDATYVIGASARATGSVIFFISDALRRYQSGIRLGGAFDSFFGPSALAGYVGELNLTERLALQAGAGFAYFPDGQRHADDALAKKSGTGAFKSSPLQTLVHVYGGVNLIFYLF
jgi:hypothetical protein